MNKIDLGGSVISLAIPGVALGSVTSTAKNTGMAKAVEKGLSDTSGAINKVNLSKSLASMQQMAEKGTITHGIGSQPYKQFNQALKIAQEYGGKATDWVKKSSSAFNAKDGRQIQTHWVENVKTGFRTLFKTILDFWKPKKWKA